MLWNGLSNFKARTRTHTQTELYFEVSYTHSYFTLLQRGNGKQAEALKQHLRLGKHYIVNENQKLNMVPNN